MTIAIPIFNKVLSLKSELENNYQIIEELMNKNNLEEVKIYEHPELYDALIEYRACMAFLKDFYSFTDNIRLQAEHLKLQQFATLYNTRS